MFLSTPFCLHLYGTLKHYFPFSTLSKVSIFYVSVFSTVCIFLRASQRIWSITISKRVWCKFFKMYISWKNIQPTFCCQRQNWEYSKCKFVWNVLQYFASIVKTTNVCISFWNTFPCIWRGYWKFNYHMFELKSLKYWFF